MTSTCPEFGFQLQFKPAHGSTTVSADKAKWQGNFRESLREFLVPRGMTIGYSFPDGYRFIVIRDGAQATQSDREALAEWGTRWAGDGTLEIGPLVDLNDLQ